MLAYYILIALPAIAFAIYLIWILRQTAPQNAREPKNDSAEEPPAVARIDTHGKFARTAIRENDSGFNATVMYMPSSQGSASAAPKKREGIAAAAPTGARLVNLGGSRTSSGFPIPPTGVTIGRNPYTCDIVLDDPRVSSRHAWIGFVDGMAVLRDLKSSNGTFLNAQINFPVTETPLRSGDTIFFGNHRGSQFKFVTD
jgi:hypothetical protein